MQASYQALRRDTTGAAEDTSAARTVGANIAKAVLAAMPGPVNRSWGGWTLASAITAMNNHQHLLPEPGRPRDRPADQQAGAQAAGVAYRFGRLSLAATAVALVDAATAPASA